MTICEEISNITAFNDSNSQRMDNETITNDNGQEENDENLNLSTPRQNLINNNSNFSLSLNESSTDVSTNLEVSYSTFELNNAKSTKYASTPLVSRITNSNNIRSANTDAAVVVVTKEKLSKEVIKEYDRTYNTNSTIDFQLSESIRTRTGISSKIHTSTFTDNFLFFNRQCSSNTRIAKKEFEKKFVGSTKTISKA